MTESKKSSFTVEVKAPGKEEELKEAEDRLQRIDSILAGIQEGWTADLWRISPGWCEGHLEAKTIVDSTPIDLNYIADTWGGEVIQLTVKDQNGKYVKRVNIPMKSFPPRSWGEDLLHPRDKRKQGVNDKENVDNHAKDPFGSIESILSIVERLRGKDEPKILEKDNSLDLGIIELLLKLQMQNQRESSPMGGVEQFLQMAGAFKELKGLLGEEKPASTEGGNDMLGQVMGILDAYSKIKSTDEKKPRIAPPSAPPKFFGPVSPNPQVKPVQVNQVPLNKVSEGSKALNAEQLADLLASLANQNPQMASDALMIALDKMPESSREKVLNNFYEMFDEDEEMFDENENNMNNIHNETRANGSEKSQGR